jgi:hypothetical protein
MLGAVAALLALYVLVEGTPPSGTAGLGPVIGASLGASVTYMLTRRQRRQEDAERRRVLATSLLSEIRFLERLLRDITTAVIPGEPGEEMIEPYRTAVYDSAGANLLLFSRDTVHDLDALYQLVHRLREELEDIRRGQINASVDHYDSVRLRAIYAVAYIRQVASRLQDEEGGMWPRPLPFWSVPADELPPLPPPVFQDNDPRRRPTPWPESEDDEPV